MELTSHQLNLFQEAMSLSGAARIAVSQRDGQPIESKLWPLLGLIFHERQFIRVVADRDGKESDFANAYTSVMTRARLVLEHFSVPTDLPTKAA